MNGFYTATKLQNPNLNPGYLYLMPEDDTIKNLLIKLDNELTVSEMKQLREQLIMNINDLLVHNFDYLVHLLYRIDVSESRLKKLLNESPHTDAAQIITDLIIQRQEEKQQSRISHPKTTDQDDEEKW